MCCEAHIARFWLLVRRVSQSLREESSVSTGVEIDMALTSRTELLIPLAPNFKLRTCVVISNPVNSGSEAWSRKFYEIPSENLLFVRHNRKVKNLKKIGELFKYMKNRCIGKDLTFTGPYGLRKGTLQGFKTSV